MSHVTRDTTFKVKGQGHQTALLSASVMRKAVQQSAWEHIRRGKVLVLFVRCVVLSGAMRWGTHGGRRGGAYCVATRTACCGSCDKKIYNMHRQSKFIPQNIGQYLEIPGRSRVRSRHACISKKKNKKIGFWGFS